MKVLVIDIDPQQHLTYSLGLEGYEIRKSIFHLLKGEISLEESVLSRGNLDVIISSHYLEELEMKMAYIKKDDLIKNHLKFLKAYNYVLFDCPPNLNILTVNAMIACNEVFIPIQTEFLALQGMGRLMKLVREIRKERNKRLTINGIIATRYDHRKRLSNDVVNTIIEYFGDKLFKTYIKENIDLAVAPSYKQSIFEYKPKSQGAQDYLDICNEIIAQEEFLNFEQEEKAVSRPSSFIELIKAEIRKKLKRD